MNYATRDCWLRVDAKGCSPSLAVAGPVGPSWGSQRFEHGLLHICAHQAQSNRLSRATAQKMGSGAHIHLDWPLAPHE